MTHPGTSCTLPPRSIVSRYLIPILWFREVTEGMHVQATPTERVIGRVRLNVAIGPIARLFAAEAWRESDNHGGGGVFAGRVGEVVENVEREPDPSHPPVGLFNLDAHAHDVDSGHPVPYLDVRACVSRDGVPVLPEVPLLPVARPHKGVAGLHYGNNVRLAPSGTYRVLVRLAPSALTGTDAGNEVEFILDFANATQ